MPCALYHFLVEYVSIFTRLNPALGGAIWGGLQQGKVSSINNSYAPLLG